MTTDNKTKPEVEAKVKTKATKPTKREAVISKNTDEVTFVYAPIYNLSNVRKNALSLITRVSNDPAKVETVRETLVVLLAVLDVRAEHGAKQRAADVAAQKAADKARAKAAAEHREAEAKRNIADADKTRSHWMKVLDGLKGK